MPLSAQFQLQAADMDAYARFLNGGKSNFGTQRIIRTLLVMFGLLLVAGLTFRSQLPSRPSVYAPRVLPGLSWVTLAPLLAPMMMFPVFYVIALGANKKARGKLPILQNPSTVTLGNENFRVQFGPTDITTRLERRAARGKHARPSVSLHATQRRSHRSAPRLRLRRRIRAILRLRAPKKRGTQTACAADCLSLNSHQQDVPAQRVQNH